MYRYDFSNVLLVDMDYIVTLFAIIEKCFSYGEGESESHWVVSNSLQLHTVHGILQDRILE